MLFRLFYVCVRVIDTLGQSSDYFTFRSPFFLFFDALRFKTNKTTTCWRSAMTNALLYPDGAPIIIEGQLGVLEQKSEDEKLNLKLMHATVVNNLLTIGMLRAAKSPILVCPFTVHFCGMQFGSHE